MSPRTVVFLLLALVPLSPAVESHAQELHRLPWTLPDNGISLSVGRAPRDHVEVPDNEYS